jgi:NTE family protein
MTATIRARSVAAMLSLLLMAGCSTYRPWQNIPAPGEEQPASARPIDQPVVVAVTLSGGGARAAAFGLGVLRELKSTRFHARGEPTSLLDELVLISGVSGGSVLAAHFAAFGDESLARFEAEFLLDDFQTDLVDSAIASLYRLSSPWYGRSHVLADRLDELYRGRTFGDLRSRARGPDLIVTATDLTTGAPFEFTAQQFALICSHLSSVPLSFAVAASSAVPIVLTPMTLRNYAGSCGAASAAVEHGPAANYRARLLRATEQSYLDVQDRPYIHLIDGGLADNLGIRGLLDRLIAGGSLAASFRHAAPGSIRKIALVAVNSERDLGERIDHRDRVPTTYEVLHTLVFGAGSRSTSTTLAMMNDDIERWRLEVAEQRGALGSPFAAEAELHVISISLRDVADPALRQAVVTVPTAFSISPGQVHDLIEAGRDALRRSPAFQRLRRSLANEPFTPLQVAEPHLQP